MKKFILAIFTVFSLLFLNRTEPLFAQTHSVNMQATLPSAYANIWRMKLANNGPIPQPGDTCQTGEVAMFTTLIFQCNGAGRWELLDNVWVENDTTNTVSLRNPNNLPLGVSIGTDLKEFKLTISNDGGIIAKGTKGSGATLTTEGSGARLIWYPKKAAFRAGEVTGDQWNNTSIGNYSVAFGRNNAAKTDFSVIGGGDNNVTDTATGLTGYGVIGGGRNNSMLALDSVIAGGNTNIIQDTTSRCTISGGSNNTITATTSVATIAGGEQNIASGDWDVIGGGVQNHVNGGHVVAGASVIAGGYQNNINSYRNFIGGGGNNTITGAYNVLGGGQSNSIDTVGWGTIGGGAANQITGGRTTGTIGGGHENQVSSDFGIVAGGNGNNVSGDKASIVGGSYNIASGTGAFIGGGDTNVASTNTNTVVVGGDHNVASGDRSFVGGGTSNHATNGGSSVVSGEQNIASGQYSSIGGGAFNHANGFASTIAGGYQNSISSNGIYSSILGGGINNTIEGTYSSIINGSHNDVAGNYSLAVGNNVHVTGNNSVGFGDSFRILGDNTFAFANFGSLTDITYNDAFVILSNKTAIGDSSSLPVLSARLNVWRDPTQANEVAVSINDVMQLTPRATAPGACNNANLGKIYVDNTENDLCFCAGGTKWVGITTGTACN